MKPVVDSTAYLLISHGSRDPRPQEAMNQLAELVRQHLDPSFQSSYSPTGEPIREQSEHAFLNPRRMHGSDESGKVTSVLAHAQTSAKAQQTSQVESPVRPAPFSSSVIVETACLELSELALREQIYEFGCRLIAAGVTELRLLPVFLMAGVHVMEDIPEEIAAARQQLGDRILLTVCDHLGSHPDISTVLKKRLASVPAENSLLVAHGSRRPKGNKGIEDLAKRLDTPVAYWATPPDIETQVIELMQQGCQKLTILPYFLFAGGITDAIAHRTEELAERFPKVQFRLLPTLGATAELAQLSTDMIQAI